MSNFDLYGIGNGIVDIFVKVSDQDFAQLDFEKASMRLVEIEEQIALLKQFESQDPLLASGGSVANSVIAAAQLGAKAAFGCCLGDDRYGLHYNSEFDDYGIELGNPLIVNQSTGTSLVLITPDAERTMRTCLAVSSHLSAEHVNEKTVRSSKWLFIEGYLFSNPNMSNGAISAAIDYAKKSDCKIAITFSESWVVDSFYDQLKQAVESADLVFANELEAQAYAKTNDNHKAFEIMKESIPGVVVTMGAEGVLVSYDGSEGHVEAFPCEPVDLTGAGDMFAGAFLYGISHGHSAIDSAKAGCRLASEVITQVGARLHQDVKEIWQSAISS